jgi:hypothetical protein
MKETLFIPSPNPHSFGLGTVSIISAGMQKPYRSWIPFFKDTPKGVGDQRLNI